MTVIDTYLQDVTPIQKQELEKIRTIVHDMIPDVEEVISYGMPTFKYKQKFVIHIAAFKDHMSVFPTGEIFSVDLEKKLAEFRASKGTLQFTEQKLIPEKLIREIITARLASINEKSKD